MQYIIQSAYAPLYAEHDENSEYTDEVLHGMSVLAEKSFGDWLYVRTAYNYRGWLQRKNIAAPVFYPDTRSFWITASAADVRAEPASRAAFVTCLTRGGMVCAHAREVDEWSHIMLADGRSGYIRTAFLSESPEHMRRLYQLPIGEEYSQAFWKAVDTPDDTGVDALREKICLTAKTYLGVQYRWGGKTPFGIDCSGLCFMAYWLNGIRIYRDARIEPGFAIKKISPSRAVKGDLLFFPGHVGMSLGDGTMIHSSEAGNGVRIEPLTPEWMCRITEAGSVWVC